MKQCIFIRVKWWLLVALSVFVMTSMYGKQMSSEAVADIIKISDVYDIISNNYVDKTNTSDITGNAIEGMLSKLDPHSKYLTATQVKESQEMLQGEFYGIGVSYTLIDDTVNIVQLIDGGPAQKEGIEVGDKILYAGDVCLVGVPTDTIQAYIKGRRNTKVSLLIERSGRSFRQEITRDRIPISSVVSSYLVTPDVGLVRLDKFAENTGKDVVSAMNKLKQNGASKFIIDLRGNGGGLLYSAAELLSQFIPKGTLLVETKGEHRASKRIESYDGYQKFLRVPVVVLIDHYSASASEIFAGAMQDLGRAKVVGCRSFGKGLVQQPFHLSDGSEIRLTVSRYYTPNGRCIQHPYKDGEYIDSLEYGIYPDVYIEPDTVKMTSLERAVIKKQLLQKVSLHHYVKNKASFSAFKTPEQLYKESDVSDILSALQSELLNVGVDFTKNEFDECSDFFSLYIKGLIAEYIYGRDAFYVIINFESEEVRAALDILQKNM